MNYDIQSHPASSAQRSVDHTTSVNGCPKNLFERRIAFLAIAIGAIAAFVMHFRPWEVAFLEEWPLAEYWVEHGPAQFVAHYFEWSLSRPLHLVPTEIGLALSGGSPSGIFLILGLVAAGQFVLVLWALRPISQSFWLSATVALFVALHPFWPGGFLQRFLPAQTAALALVVAAGFLIRFLHEGRVRSVAFSAVALLFGLCVYPGPAVAAPFLALVLAIAVRAPLRRRIIAVAAITATSAVMTVYSLVITRLINPGGMGYEAGNFGPATMAGPRDIVPSLLGALLNGGSIIVTGVFAVVALGALLALSGAVPHWAGWLMSGSAVISPLCAAVFFGNVTWLQDIDRIGYATSLGIFAALAVWPAASLTHRRRLEGILAIALAAGSIAGAIWGIQHWQPYIQLQHRLLSELAPVVKTATGDDIVVVVDHSGTYGSAFTLPQYYVSSASHVMNGDPTPVWLCYLASDPPLDGATVCDPRDTGDDPELVASFEFPSGGVDIYIGNPTSND